MSNIYPANVLGNNTGLENISKSSPAPGWYKHLEVSQAPSFINRRHSSKLQASSRASSDLSPEVGLSPVIHWRPLRQKAKALDHAIPVDFQSAFDEDDLIPPWEHTSEFIKVTEPSSRNSSPISSPFEQGGVVPTKTIRPLMERRTTQVGPEAYEDIILDITETKSQRADAHSNMKAAEGTAENVEVALEELSSSIISDEDNLITKAVNQPLQGKKRQRNYMDPNNFEAAFDVSNSNSSKRSKLHSENKYALSSILSDQSNSPVRVVTRPFIKNKTNVPSTIDPFAAPFEKTTSPHAVGMYKSTEKYAPSSHLSDQSNSPVRAVTRPFPKKETNVSSTINPYVTAFEETTDTRVVDANKSTEKSAHSSILSDQSNSPVRIATRPFKKKKTNIPSTIDPFAAPFEKTTSPRAVDMYKSTETSVPSSHLSDCSNSPVRAATRPFTKKKTNIPSTIDPFAAPFEKTTSPRAVDMYKSTEKSSPSSRLSDLSNSPVRAVTRPFTKKITNVSSTINPYVTAFEENTNAHVVDANKSPEKSAHSSILSDQSNSSGRIATRPFTTENRSVRLRMALTEDEKCHFLEETRKRNRERMRIFQEKVEMGREKRKTMKDYFSTISKKINPVPKPAAVPKKPPKLIDPSLLINGKRYRTPRLARPKRWFKTIMYDPVLKCCEKKYGPLKKRRKAEEFVIYICDLVSTAMKLRKNYLGCVEAVKKALYKLGLIKTLMEFFKFVEDYLPHEFREKAIPCAVGYGQYRGPPWVQGTKLFSELTFKD